MRPSTRRRLTYVGVAALLLVAAGTIVGLLVAEGGDTSTVSFGGREYVQPDTLSASEVRGYGPLVRLSERRRGMPIELGVDQERAMMSRRRESPTLLFLRRDDGSFVVYELVGGP